MVITVTLGAIGVAAPTLDDSINAAKAGGFAGLDFEVKKVLDISPDHALEKFGSAGVSPQVFGVPFEWRASEESWRQGLEDLPKLAQAAKRIGCSRCATWIMPASNDLEFGPNFDFHVARLTPIAQILGDEGITFGLEFVGPKTLRDQFKHEFIYTPEGMLEMGTKIGPNTGLLLDSFHWFTSGGDQSTFSNLTSDQIVYVHINDAVEGRNREEQIDGDRRLPGATGVIDIVGFLRGLSQLGYQGPIACEPFFSGLQDLSTDQDRLDTVKQSIDAVFAKACV
jgi:sugar phosphate isomerase/epimerase